MSNENKDNAYKGCHNCVHRRGIDHLYWQCVRTGFYTKTEMRHGGRCVNGLELRLWSPRKSLISKIIGIFKSDKQEIQQEIILLPGERYE